MEYNPREAFEKIECNENCINSDCFNDCKKNGIYEICYSKYLEEQNKQDKEHIKASEMSIRDLARWNEKLQEQNKQLVKDSERAYQVLSIYGVPKERAKSITNGIQVLVSRMDKETEILKEQNKQMLEALIEAKKLNKPNPDEEDYRIWNLIDSTIESITQKKITEISV
jgi:hypothetical protein